MNSRPLEIGRRRNIAYAVRRGERRQRRRRRTSWRARAARLAKGAARLAVTRKLEWR